MEALHALMQKQATEKVKKSSIPGFIQPTFPASKTQQQVGSYPRSECTEHISEVRKPQNGDTRKNWNFLANRPMGNIHRFQGCLFPYPNKPHSRKYLRFHIQGQFYQSKALPFGLSTADMIVKEVKLMAKTRL